MPGTEFHIGRIELSANTGTHLDTPFHRFAGGFDLAELPLEAVADLTGRVIDLPAGRRSVEPSDLPPAAELAGRAVLFRTGWSRNFATPPYFSGHPFVSAAAAAQLVAARAALVGIDSLNVDEVTGNERPVHTALRRAHPDPVKLRGLGSFPVRAFAVLERELT